MVCILHCESILSAHCCDAHWLKWKPVSLFKAIQHSINTPFALWQRSTTAFWLICLPLPCQSIMNHLLFHRTTLNSPARRKREGGGRLVWKVEEEILQCWQERMGGRLDVWGGVGEKGEWRLRRTTMNIKLLYREEEIQTPFNKVSYVTDCV